MKNLDKRTALQDKLRRQVLKKGINLLSPHTTFLSKDTSYGKNITIEPNSSYTINMINVNMDLESIIFSNDETKAIIIDKNSYIIKTI